MTGLRLTAMFVLLAIALGASGFPFQNEPYDEIEVIGKRTSGFAKCGSATCWTAYNDLRNAMWVSMVLQGQHAVLDDIVVDDYQFCAALRSEKPDDCGVMPATPWFSSPAYTTNGCGSTEPGITEALAQFAVGDYDEPVPGAVFTPACDTHDTCYGYALDKNQCDADLEVNLINICGGLLGQSGHTECLEWATIYALVFEEAGQPAFDRASRLADCAFWHEEMDANNCPK